MKEINKIRYRYTLWRFSVIFSKRDNLCDFLFVFKPSLIRNGVYSKGIISMFSNEDEERKGWGTIFDRVPL